MTNKEEIIKTIKEVKEKTNRVETAMAELFGILCKVDWIVKYFDLEE